VEIRNLDAATPFTTKDGSTIRSLLDRGTAAVQNQSLAEATLEAGHATERHYHRASEELYYVVEGRGEMEIDGERADVGPGDAILIPPGAWHQLTAGARRVRILCCCAPPYSDDDTFFGQEPVSK
jgi:mannose-6-phosphate isomerase-like protein (cupin superfamily)